MRKPFRRLQESTDPRLRSPIRAAQHLPHQADVDRLWSQMQAQLSQLESQPQASTAENVDGNGGHHARPRASLLRRLFGRFGSVSGIGLLGLLGLLVASVVRPYLGEPTTQAPQFHNPPAPPTTDAAAPAANRAAASTTIAATTRAQPQATRRSSANPAPEPSPETPATPARGTSSSATGRPRRRVQEAMQPAVAKISELALIDQAQAQLTSRPQASLLALDHHAQLYPAGQLTQERELLRIEALRQLGHSDRARRQARVFLRRFPHSPHLPRVQAIADGIAAPLHKEGRQRPLTDERTEQRSKGE